MARRTKHGFSRLTWLPAALLAAAPELAACSRSPESDSVKQPVASMPAASGAVSTAPVASAPESAEPVASASSAPAAPASAARSNPWTIGVDCSLLEKSPEQQGLAPETRARSRASCDAKEEFRGFVAARQGCTTASDCSNVAGACPFGCFIPVAKGSVSEVTGRLAALGARLDKAGHRCVYRCMGPPAEACIDGRCTTE